MRERINLAKFCRKALRGLPMSIDGHSPLPVPKACQYTLDDLLIED
jgi:hypothetical protein